MNMRKYKVNYIKNFISKEQSHVNHETADIRNDTIVVEANSEREAKQKVQEKIEKKNFNHESEYTEYLVTSVQIIE